MINDWELLTVVTLMLAKGYWAGHVNWDARELSQVILNSILWIKHFAVSTLILEMRKQTKKGYLSIMSKVMHFAKHSSPELSNSKTYAAHQSTPVPYICVFKFNLFSTITFTPLEFKSPVENWFSTVIPGEI